MFLRLAVAGSHTYTCPGCFAPFHVHQVCFQSKKQLQISFESRLRGDTCLNGNIGAKDCRDTAWNQRQKKNSLSRTYTSVESEQTSDKSRVCWFSNTSPIAVPSFSYGVPSGIAADSILSDLFDPAEAARAPNVLVTTALLCTEVRCKW